MASHEELLLGVLQDLGNEEFEHFRWLLKKAEVDDFPAIPKSRLEEANRLETVDQMVQTYGLPGALQITVEVLKKIPRNDLVERFSKSGFEPNKDATDVGETSENTGASSIQQAQAASHHATTPGAQDEGWNVRNVWNVRKEGGFRKEGGPPEASVVPGSGTTEDEQPLSLVADKDPEDEQPLSLVADKDPEDEQTLPETPPCSEEEEEEENKENNVDGVDGWMAGWIVDSIKSAVYHLLNLTIRKYRVDECYGCQVNHPSQRNHGCLEVLEEDFLQDHYEHLMKRLNTPRFIPSIQRLLMSRNVNMDDLRVRMVAETLLHELKTAKCRWEALSDACENLTGEDTEKMKQL